MRHIILALMGILFSFATYAQKTGEELLINIDLGHTIQYQSTSDWTKTSFYQDKKRSLSNWRLAFHPKFPETELQSPLHH